MVPWSAMWSYITWTSEAGMWESGVDISWIDIFDVDATQEERIKKKERENISGQSVDSQAC